MGYNSIAWLPLCAGLTVLGLVLSYVAGRRRGRMSMMRGAAWSLLPVAAYLTGSVEMFAKIGAAIGHYADGFVFSPVKWAGIAVAGLAVVLFTATSGRARRRTARLAHGASRAKGPSDVTPGAATGALGSAAPAPKSAAPKSAKTQKLPQPRKPGKPAADDDDLSDIENILRKRGI